MNQEENYIKIIEKAFSKDFPTKNNVNEVGIGDDSAIYEIDETTKKQVVCTDAIVEGTHFDLKYFSLEDVGWKSIIVNQSDLASMGSNPNYFNVSCGIPPNFKTEDFKLLTNGMKLACDQYGGVVIGGDIVKSDKIFISVTAIGSLEKSEEGPDNNFAMLRTNSMPGDYIGVTGSLGNSLAGRMLLNEGKREKKFSAIHKRPSPRVKDGLNLVRSGVKACIDISDGLHSDLEKLCKASNVTAHIDVDKIPIDDRLKVTFPDSFIDMAISGGEDFELLFTLKSINQLPEDYKRQVSVIGKMVKPNNADLIIYKNTDSEILNPTITEWKHF